MGVFTENYKVFALALHFTLQILLYTEDFKQSCSREEQKSQLSDVEDTTFTIYLYQIVPFKFKGKLKIL